jgi:hypothetical protein
MREKESMDGNVRKTQSAGDFLAALPAFNGYVARMMLWPTEAWLRLQSEFLNAAAPAAAQWLDRRREGTTAALASIERLQKCRDVRDASEIQSEWVRSEAKRLEADMRSLSEQTLLVAQAAEKAARQGVQSASGSAA